MTTDPQQIEKDADLEAEMIFRLSPLRGSGIQPKNKNFEANLQKRMANLAAAKKAERELVTRREQASLQTSSIADAKSPATADQPQDKGFWAGVVAVLRVQTTAVLALGALFCLTTTTFASYLASPQVRNEVNKAIGLPQYSTIAIQSEPVGAEVVLNGQSLGNTPFIKDIPVGDYDLQLKLADHKEVTTKITLEANKRLDLSYTLEEIIIDVYEGFVEREFDELGVKMHLLPQYGVELSHTKEELPNSYPDETNDKLNTLTITHAFNHSLAKLKLVAAPAASGGAQANTDTQMCIGISVLADSSLDSSEFTKEIDASVSADWEKLDLFLRKLIEENSLASISSNWTNSCEITDVATNNSVVKVNTKTKLTSNYSSSLTFEIGSEIAAEDATGIIGMLKTLASIDQI